MPKRLVIVAVSVLVTAVAVAASVAAGKQFSAWGTPANAESVAGTSSELNTSSLDGCPIVSPDGLSLYMASDRPGGLGGLDIWVAHRASSGARWEAPVNVGAPVNSASDDFCPSPMPRGVFLFVSTRPGGCGDADIYLTRSYGEGWQSPLHLGCSVNSPAQEASPYVLFQRGKHGKERTLLYFSSNRPGGFAVDSGPADHDVYVSALTEFGFGHARLVPGLNTPANDARPNLRQDGLEIVFDSNRPGSLGGQDVYASARESAREPWPTPVNLGAVVNSPAMETRASLSWDGTTLYFGSNRPGGEGSTDIYFSTRNKVAGRR